MYGIVCMLVSIMVPSPVWSDGSVVPQLVDVLDFVDDYHAELYERKGRWRKYRSIQSFKKALTGLRGFGGLSC